MRKKISVDRLVVGMYLQELCGSWISHPFWRSSFVIADEQQIALIKASAVREVWIDTGKGLDVVSVVPVVVTRGPDAVVPTETVPMPLATAALPIAAELARARQICAESTRAVTAMFAEARMGNAIDALGVDKLVRDISDSVARNASALISLARLKSADNYTYMHSVAVCAMMIALARQLGMADAAVRAAGVAGLLHDMGKALVPVEVLNKPGKLTPEEFAVVRTHPVLGHKLLSNSTSVDAMALDVCMHHHEKMDGSGYPDGLEGASISLYARMGAVCDVYDAITSNRPYKAGWDPAESMRQMGNWAGGHFDRLVFQAFAKSLGIYPVGSLVRLSSGRIGVVTEQSAGSLTTPVVFVFFSTKSMLRTVPEKVDLSLSGCPEKISMREDPANWNFPDVDDMWNGQSAAS